MAEQTAELRSFVEAILRTTGDPTGRKYKNRTLKERRGYIMRMLETAGITTVTELRDAPTLPMPNPSFRQTRSCGAAYRVFASHMKKQFTLPSRSGKPGGSTDPSRPLPNDTTEDALRSDVEDWLTTDWIRKHGGAEPQRLERAISTMVTHLRTYGVDTLEGVKRLTQIRRLDSKAPFSTATYKYALDRSGLADKAPAKEAPKKTMSQPTSVPTPPSRPLPKPTPPPVKTPEAKPEPDPSPVSGAFVLPQRSYVDMVCEVLKRIGWQVHQIYDGESPLGPVQIIGHDELDWYGITVIQQGGGPDGEVKIFGRAFMENAAHCKGLALVPMMAVVHGRCVTPYVVIGRSATLQTALTKEEGVYVVRPDDLKRLADTDGIAVGTLGWNLTSF